MKRVACVAVLGLGLGACDPATVAGFAMDGLSYGYTGKTVTQHAVDWLDDNTCVVELLRHRPDGGPIAPRCAHIPKEDPPLFDES